MKKIIAVLLSIMLAFGVATSAFAAVVDPSDSVARTPTITEPDDSRFDDEEKPSTTHPVEEVPSTDAPTTEVPTTEAPLTTGPSTSDPEIPDSETEPSILDRIYNAIMIFVKEMIQIIDDSCDKLIDFIDRHIN